MTKLLMSELCTMRKGQTINEVDIYNLKSGGIDNSVPIISSSTMNNGVMGFIDKKHINLYKKIGRSGDLSWVTNGYAGKVTYRETDFLPTEKCGVAAIKKKYKELVDPKWLEIYLNSITKKYVVAKEGNGKLEIVQMKNIPVVIPDKKIQELIVQEYKVNKNTIKNVTLKIDTIKETLNNNIKKKTKLFKISDLFFITSGKRIVKEEVYNNPGSLPIVSAQTDNSFWYADKNWLSKITKNNKSLIFNKPCLSWVCVGKAGFMFYRDFEFYLTDNAGVLCPKKENIHLKWFIVTYQDKIRDSRQGDREGQSTMFTEHMANIEVEIPVKENGEIDLELQNDIYAEYKRLSDIKEKLESMVDKYSL